MTHFKNICRIFFVILTLLFAACKTNDTNRFLKTISVKTDTLQIDNTKDTLLFCPKGTGLFFEKESFILADGSYPKGNITIQLKECYDFSDIVRENLTTTSNDKLLESRGMIFVKAMAGDQELRLKKDRKYIIHFPKKPLDGNKQMNLFYSSENNEATINWDIDSTSLLKVKARITGTTETNVNGIETGAENYSSFWNLRDRSKENVFMFFDSLFDETKIKNINLLTGKYIICRFTKTGDGTLKNLSIHETKYDSVSSMFVNVSSDTDPYFSTFFNSIPPLRPENEKGVPVNTFGEIILKIDYFPDYETNSNYNIAFEKKYNAFRNSRIKTIDDLELSYYIFSASKLGWINCDYFWDTRDEKIDYIVKADPDAKPVIRLIFKQARSIMPGTLTGEKYVFKNVPLNQEVKIVSISYKNKQPLLAVTTTRTSKQPYDKLIYREFSLPELVKQLNTP